jgi:GntR family negative regulator for fad regulon and positive regulator of fabA
MEILLWSLRRRALRVSRKSTSLKASGITASPGSILPAERELSELIGVTRTTLREVLQRLARDGWLTIQHGKPTKVNNFWETSGLNILETLARLDHDSVPQLIDNLLSVRTNISTIFIRTAFRQHPDKALAVLDSAREVEDHADAFAELDYNIFRGLAFASGNPIYGLILNGMKGCIPASAVTILPGSAQPGAGLLSSAGEGVRRAARSGL